MSDPSECVFVDSDTRYRWDSSTMLPGTAFHRSARRTSTGPLPRIDEQVPEPITQLESSAGPRRQASWPVWTRCTVMSMTSRSTSAACRS